MQASNNKNEIMLPVGGTPFWEQEPSEENDEGRNLKSISDSLVLLKSLKQSRDRWLHSTFPKFSVKTRGNKAPEIVQPPHTIQQRAKSTIRTGPHLFEETILYEVNYLPSEVPPTAAPTPPAANPYWPSTASYNNYSYRFANGSSSSAPPPTVTPSPTPVTPQSSQPETVPTPLITSLSTVSIITPSLISQVNAAASADPIFSNLLQLAAAKTATEDQLQTLGLLIQSLAAIDHAKKVAADALQQQPTPPPVQPIPPPVKPFDLVLEFRETPSDRLLFPRGTVHAEKLAIPNNAGNNCDILLTLCLSNDKVCVSLDDQLVQEADPRNSGLYKATIQMKDSPSYMWDLIMRWIGGEEKNALYKKQLDNLVQPKRLHLGLQLPPGTLLTQLQAACAPAYSLKPVRQGPAPQPRAPRQRKPYADKKTTAAKTTTGDSVPAKKQRVGSKAAAAPIQCVSCSQKDVPLILGGRYCRPCVEAGKHTAVPPQIPVITGVSQSTAVAAGEQPGQPIS